MFDDIKAIYEKDPAAKGVEFLLYPGWHAVFLHKWLVHRLYKLRVPFFPRMLSQFARFLTGIEIHPGAVIGRGFFIDHGMGVVIGETAVIGDNCQLFHNVTLGGTGKVKGKRHPTIGNSVMVGTGSILLGPIKVGSNVNIGANTMVIDCDIPDNCTVVGNPGRIVRLNGERVDLELKKTFK